MYSGSGFSDWEIGDITVIMHNGVYHLFHLIIPNHDYIAHAVSKDGISWKRVKNAIFVGQPGEWDDDMLWTMHVVQVNGQFEMYYTGLQRKDRGVVSRVGFAESPDLLDWTKKDKSVYPIEPKGIYYETSSANPRTWLSFRDPFRFEHESEVYLLIGARTIHGPISRRGCVGLINITNDTIRLMPPLFFPRMYDDVECPCIFKLKDRFYLIGSIREDIKVRYWYSFAFFGDYLSFQEDGFLPQGNYAARVTEDGDHLLIYNFYYANGNIDALRVLPPPKELDADENGQLLLKSFYRWEFLIKATIPQDKFEGKRNVLDNSTASLVISSNRISFHCESGYEVLSFQRNSASFIWEGTIRISGSGIFGLVSDLDDQGNGYYYGINMVNGVVNVRAWGFNPTNARQNFIYNNIQSALFEPRENGSLRFRLIRYGNYIELAIDNIVRLTLMDYSFSGKGFGIYSCSCSVELTDSVFKILPNPEGEYASQEESQKVH